MPRYTLVLRRPPGAAAQRERVEFDSGERPLSIGDTVVLGGQWWQLVDQQIFPADSAPELEAFACDPIASPHESPSDS